MLTRIDRFQIATQDASRDASGWVELLGAELQAKDRVRALGAKRTTYRLGQSEVEFLEPDGSGVIAESLARRGRSHLFAGGISTKHFDKVVARLRERGLAVEVENGQAFLNAEEALGVDCPLVLSVDASRDRVGRIDFLYEVTLLARDTESICSRMAELFGLERGAFKAISSDKFGYTGTLTLFSDDDLHRFEVICPHSNATTMGRYFEKNGPSFYMCFGESDQMVAIEQSAAAAGAGITVDRPAGRTAKQSPDQMWLHASTLGGAMLGISRPTMAWTWSGHPERVKGVA